jgi:hypothetical protein
MKIRGGSISFCVYEIPSLVGLVPPLSLSFSLSLSLPLYIQGVSGGIVNTLGGGSMDYSE